MSTSTVTVRSVPAPATTAVPTPPATAPPPAPVRSRFSRVRDFLSRVDDCSDVTTLQRLALRQPLR